MRYSTSIFALAAPLLVSAAPARITQRAAADLLVFREQTLHLLLGQKISTLIRIRGCPRATGDTVLYSGSCQIPRIRFHRSWLHVRPDPYSTVHQYPI